MLLGMCVLCILSVWLRVIEYVYVSVLCICMNMCLSEGSSLVSVEPKFHGPNELFESG